MANPPLRVPWPYLDRPEPVGASEFGAPTGYVDPDDYRGKTASEDLEHDQRESDDYGRQTD